MSTDPPSPSVSAGSSPAFTAQELALIASVFTDVAQEATESEDVDRNNEAPLLQAVARKAAIEQWRVSAGSTVSEAKKELLATIAALLKHAMQHGLSAVVVIPDDYIDEVDALILAAQAGVPREIEQQIAQLKIAIWDAFHVYEDADTNNRQPECDAVELAIDALANSQSQRLSDLTKERDELKAEIEREITQAQEAICEAIERRFKELIPHALDHYACKLAKQTLRRTIDQLMSRKTLTPTISTI